MKLFPLLLLTTCLLTFNACNKKDCGCDPPPKLGDFTFTKYHCLCQGTCINGFKIADDQLYRGSGALCLPNNLTFEATPLTQEKLVIADKLRDMIPADMLAHLDKTYGCPDCGDWGGYYVTLMVEGKKHTWYLDTQKDALDTEIRAFVEELENTLIALNN
jgi:hypothetical protein